MLRSRPRTRWFAVVGMTIGAAFAGACTRNAYVIGAVCPPGDGGSAIDASCPGLTDGGDGASEVAEGGNATFTADFTTSGTTALGPLEPSSVFATLTLPGVSAAALRWPSDEGVALGPGGGAPEPGLPAPFIDSTRAVGLPAGAASYAAETAAVGAVGADDFVVEVVLRSAMGATIVEKAAASGTGWSLRTDATGLVLAVGDADPAHVVRAAAPLIADAWYHCMAWVSHAAGMRVDCNGRAGAMVPVLAAGSIDVATPLVVGGGAPSRLAFFKLTHVTPGYLREPSTWLDVGRRRFAALTGTLPVARGSVLPRPGLRDSPAYVDLQATGPNTPRRLFLVGPDWPRVACRTGVTGDHDCGFLSEPLRTRRVPADARMWTATELTTAVGPLLPWEGPPMIGLVPSTAAAAHALGVMAPDTTARQVFSFFARAGSVGRVAAHVGALGDAVYDLRAGTVVSAPAAVRATIEPWGDGVYRCVYAYTGVAGSVLHALALVDAAGAQAFAGDGAAVGIQVAGLQVDLGLVLAGSLLAADTQQPDHLTFVGDDGNLPTGAGATIDVRVLLPEGPRLTDQAIFNLNRGTAFKDQVQLFVRGDMGLAEFWGISTGATYWTFDNPTTLIDGRRHTMQASWNQTSAHIVVDGITQDQNVLLPDPPPFVLDRIDVGFSEKSGGPLEGLIAGLRIGPP
jgi:hypothetical protein